MIEIVRNRNIRCLLVGGEAEGDRLRRLAKSIGSNHVEIADGWPLPELAQKLKSCAAFIGHDSGITHLAAAVGLPVFVLWGPTNETVWRPLGKTILLRGGNELSQLTPEIVLRELEGTLKSIQ